MPTLDRPAFSERCYREATRSAIFLLQHRTVCIYGTPRDSRGDEIEFDEGFIDPSTGCEMTIDELVSQEVANAYWLTESVWLSREEANAFGESHAYRWPNGWRVYCVCAEGELRTLIKGT